MKTLQEYNPGDLVYVPMVVTSRGPNGRVMGWNPLLGESGRWEIPATAGVIELEHVDTDLNMLILSVFAARMAGKVGT